MLVDRLFEWWKRRETRPESLVEARMVSAILAFHSLWLLLSRPDLPRFPSLPESLTGTVSILARTRALMPGSETIEWMIYGALVTGLVAILIDRAPGWVALLAGVGMMHFGAMEEILAGIPHAYFGGFTIPALAFPLLYAGRMRESWSLTAVKGLVVASYFFAGTAKLIYSGPSWFQASTLQGWLLTRHSYADAPLALWLAERPLFCWLAVLTVGLLELGSPIVLFRPRLGTIFGLVAISGHIAIRYAMGIFYPGILLALILFDWSSFDRGAAPHQISGESAQDADDEGGEARRERERSDHGEQQTLRPRGKKFGPQW